MASAKQGGKNRKIGRHSRNPSSMNQAKRTERNKAKRAQKIIHIPPKTGNNPALRGITANGNLHYDTVEFRGVRTRVYAS